MPTTARRVARMALRRIGVADISQEPDAHEYVLALEAYEALFQQLQVVEGMDFSSFVDVAGGKIIGTDPADIDEVPDHIAPFMVDLLAARLAPIFERAMPQTIYINGLRGLRRAMFPDDRDATLTEEQEQAEYAAKRASYF